MTSEYTTAYQRLTLCRKNFSFKCHRVDIPLGSMPGTPATTGSQNVFSINSITFHKTQGTFCTGGGDGSLTFWDGMARSRVASEYYVGIATPRVCASAASVTAAQSR